MHILPVRYSIPIRCVLNFSPKVLRTYAAAPLGETSFSPNGQWRLLQIMVACRLLTFDLQATAAVVH